MLFLALLGVVVGSLTGQLLSVHNQLSDADAELVIAAVRRYRA